MRGRVVGETERGIIMPDDRPIFVISDLHIGDGGPRDNFGHKDSDRPGQLTEFLAHVKRENGKLIIIGDLFEFWQASFSKVIMRNLNIGGHTPISLVSAFGLVVLVEGLGLGVG